MTISLSTVHVIVDDPDAALAFYRDTLGLKVTNEVPYEGFKWITLVTASQPEVAIVLSQPHAGRSKEDGDALAAMLAKGELARSTSAPTTWTAPSRRLRPRPESRCSRSPPSSSGGPATSPSATWPATPSASNRPEHPAWRSHRR